MQNVDAQELAKFSELAHRWWDPESEFRPLHQINPLRLEWIDQLAGLRGKTVLDVGCGGGILAEAMARRADHVTGIDLAARPLGVARLHALEAGVENLDYREIATEALAQERPGTFDVVTCMEMLEHVPDPAAVVQACATLAKPGGWLFFSTLNRNPKSFLFAIVGAEYVLRLLPRGTHEYALKDHADVRALREASGCSSGATAYVTLEPCCHQGRTPPCVDGLIRAGIDRVVVARVDPNPRVSGKGVENLRSSGIRVDVGLMAEEAGRLIENFACHIGTGLPLVVGKVGMTLDGKIGTGKPDGRWITSLDSREFGQRLRREADALLVGIDTVLTDDPELTYRGQAPKIRPLMRVILDSQLRTPASARLFLAEPRAPVLIFCSAKASARRQKALESRGAEILRTAQNRSGLDLRAVPEPIPAEYRIGFPHEVLLTQLRIGDRISRVTGSAAARGACPDAGRCRGKGAQALERMDKGLTCPTRYSKGSPSYRATSPSFPTAREPTRPSTPRMRAASMVTEASASSAMARARTTSPPDCPNRPLSRPPSARQSPRDTSAPADARTTS